MKKLYTISLVVSFLIIGFNAKAQNTILGGQVHGTFQMDAQGYVEDTVIGAKKIAQGAAFNTYLDVIYTLGDFEGGVRYESFSPPLQGFDPRWEGSGVPYRYAKYTKENFEITAGNFYEQFGSGMILRSYQDWNLGFDNSIDGIRVKYKSKGLVIKGILGKQRYFWDKGPGLIRGFDADLSLNEAFKKMENMKTKFFLGGSWVSKYQVDQDPIYILPQNVCAFSGRLGIIRGNFDVKFEGAYKINDPNTTNGMIYKDGNIMMVEARYSKKGLGISLQAKRTDNMDFRSDRGATGFELPIGYIPAMTKQHIFMLPSIYPYATQANGEMGMQATVNYTFKKGSKLGGTYGTNVELNYSVARSIDKQQINDSTLVGTPATLGYESDPFAIGKQLYFGDFNITIAKKLNAKWKTTIEYANLFFNKEIIEGHAEPNVRANVGIIDAYYTIKPQNSLHVELEGLFTKEDKGNWMAAMIEYKYKTYFFALIDQYNYGNEDKDLRVHYFSINAGMTKGTARLALGYGKTRQGILCVGGVCRQVPASNGLTLALTSTF